MLSNQLSVEIVNKNIPGKCIDLDWNDTKLRRLTGGQEVVILHRILRGIAPRCGGKNWIFIGYTTQFSGFVHFLFTDFRKN